MGAIAIKDSSGIEHSQDDLVMRLAHEAVDRAKAELLKRGSGTPTDGTLGIGMNKCSAPVAVKAAEICKVLGPVDDSVFLELFQLYYEWVYDSGASRHFCQKRKAASFIHLAKKIKGVIINTAGGRVEANDVLQMRVARLGDKYCRNDSPP